MNRTPPHRPSPSNRPPAPRPDTPLRDHTPPQPTFAVFCPAVISANGDGYTIKPGRPLLTLTSGQLAAQFAVDRQTIYRWRQEGLIPEEFVQLAGKRKLLFRADIVPRLQAHFQAARD